MHCRTGSSLHRVLTNALCCVLVPGIPLGAVAGVATAWRCCVSAAAVDGIGSTVAGVTLTPICICSRNTGNVGYMLLTKAVFTQVKQTVMVITICIASHDEGIAAV
jgi:hypothetical protein